MSTALILIDIQNDYFPGGAMALEGSLEASTRAQEVLAVFRTTKKPLFHIQHISVQPGAAFFLPGTQGAAIHENVAPLPDEKVIQKHYPNSFRDTPLLDHLKREQIKHLVIAGMMTHMCVEATSRAAFDHGFRCTVLHDACATRALSFGDTVIPAASVHQAFLAALNGIYTKVMSTRDFLSGMR